MTIDAMNNTDNVERVNKTVAAVELHSPIFYTHHDTHVYCLFLFPFAFISLMFQLPEGGARATRGWS